MLVVVVDTVVAEVVEVVEVEVNVVAEGVADAVVEVVDAALVAGVAGVVELEVIRGSGRTTLTVRVAVPVARALVGRAVYT